MVGARPAPLLAVVAVEVDAEVAVRETRQGLELLLRLRVGEIGDRLARIGRLARAQDARLTLGDRVARRAVLALVGADAEALLHAAAASRRRGAARLLRSEAIVAAKPSTLITGMSHRTQVARDGGPPRVTRPVAADEVVGELHGRLGRWPLTCVVGAQVHEGRPPVVGAVDALCDLDAEDLATLDGAPRQDDQPDQARVLRRQRPQLLLVLGEGAVARAVGRGAAAGPARPGPRRAPLGRAVAAGLGQHVALADRELEAGFAQPRLLGIRVELGVPVGPDHVVGEVDAELAQLDRVFAALELHAGEDDLLTLDLLRERGPVELVHRGAEPHGARRARMTAALQPHGLALADGGGGDLVGRRCRPSRRASYRLLASTTARSQSLESEPPDRRAVRKPVAGAT